MTPGSWARLLPQLKHDHPLDIQLIPVEKSGTPGSVEHRREHARVTDFAEQRAVEPVHVDPLGLSRESFGHPRPTGGRTRPQPGP